MADYRIESDGTDSGQVIYHKLAGTLSSPTDRYVYKIKPNVVDLGLTLQDAKKMKLQEENYFLKNAKNTPLELNWKNMALIPPRLILLLALQTRLTESTNNGLSSALS